MAKKQKEKLRLMRRRRGLMICDVSFLLGHHSSSRMKKLEKGRAQMTLDEAIKIAHILDVKIDEIHLGNKKSAVSTIKRRAIIIAQRLSKKAYVGKFKKRLLWLTNHLIRKNKNNG